MAETPSIPWKSLIDKSINHLANVIQSYRYTFQDEVQFQDHLEKALKAEGVEYNREVELTRRDRVDFTLNYDPYIIAMEVKVGGSINSHLRQLKRYAEADGDNSIIDATVLIATKPFQVPEFVGMKPCYCIHINRI